MHGAFLERLGPFWGWRSAWECTAIIVAFGILGGISGGHVGLPGCLLFFVGLNVYRYVTWSPTTEASASCERIASDDGAALSRPASCDRPTPPSEVTPTMASHALIGNGGVSGSEPIGGVMTDDNLLLESCASKSSPIMLNNRSERQESPWIIGALVTVGVGIVAFVIITIEIGKQPKPSESTAIGQITHTQSDDDSSIHYVNPTSDVPTQAARSTNAIPTFEPVSKVQQSGYMRPEDVNIPTKFDTKDPRWKQLSQAFGFVLGQQLSLELIESEFPELAKETKEVWFAFNGSVFGESVQGIEDELAAALGGQWQEVKDEITRQLDDSLNAQELSREHATTYLAEVRARSNGQMPETIRTVLLSVHPRFRTNPALELSSGWKQTFRTKNHPKAKGVDFSISLPASWSKREGDRPNMIQIFQSGAGHGSAFCALAVKSFPLSIDYEATEADIKELFQPDQLKEMVPDGGKFLGAQSIVLDGVPAGILICDTTKQRLDITFTTRLTQFVTIQKNSMIFVDFSIVQLSESKDSLDKLQRQFLPTFKAIASTLVLNDQYK